MKYCADIFHVSQRMNHFKLLLVSKLDFLFDRKHDKPLQRFVQDLIKHHKSFKIHIDSLHPLAQMLLLNLGLRCTAALSNIVQLCILQE